MLGVVFPVSRKSSTGTWLFQRLCTFRQKKGKNWSIGVLTNNTYEYDKNEGKNKSCDEYMNDEN